MLGADLPWGGTAVSSYLGSKQEIASAPSLAARTPPFHGGSRFESRLGSLLQITIKYACPVAQLVARRPVTAEVAGSVPSGSQVKCPLRQGFLYLGDPQWYLHSDCLAL